MNRRAFTLIEVMATLTVASLMVGGAMIFGNVMTTRAMRLQVVQSEETAHDLALREMSESIKRARAITIHATPGDTNSVASGNELAITGEDGTVTYFRYLLPAVIASPSERVGEEQSLRAIYHAGQLVASSATIGDRVLINFCSVPSDVLFDLQLGIPRARWEMHLARFRGRVQPAPHSKFILIAAPLRMR